MATPFVKRRVSTQIINTIGKIINSNKMLMEITCNYWLHRITWERDVKEKLLKNNGLLLTGWGFASNDQFLNEVFHKDKNTFDTVYYKIFKSLPKNRFFLYMFLNEFKKDDLVIVPGNKGDFSVYRIVSDCPFSKEHIYKYVSDLEICNVAYDSLSRKYYRKNDRTELELGFFWKVELIIEGLSRERHAEDSLRRRLKFQGTTNNLILIKDEVDKAIKRYYENNPIEIYSEIMDSASIQILEKLRNLASDTSFEKIVEFYLRKIGADKTNIPAKNLLTKQQGDVDVVAYFDHLQVKVLVQVKHYQNEVGIDAIEQIISARSSYEEPGYTLLLWVLSSCDRFSEDAANKAVNEDVRLIDGAEFSRALLDIGIKDMNL